jgi:hypothetical protein
LLIDKVVYGECEGAIEGVLEVFREESVLTSGLGVIEDKI